jgi:hypothetical protein
MPVIRGEGISSDILEIWKDFSEVFDLVTKVKTDGIFAKSLEFVGPSVGKVFESVEFVSISKPVLLSNNFNFCTEAFVEIPSGFVLQTCYNCDQCIREIVLKMNVHIVADDLQIIGYNVDIHLQYNFVSTSNLPY